MKQDHVTITECHQLLQNVLRDAFNVQTILFTPPYTDIKKIDNGMRAAVWSDYEHQNSQLFLSDAFPPYRIIIVRSNLGFYNVLATFGKNRESKSEFIAIGPFRNNELSANYYTQILKEAMITPAEIRSIKAMYERIPFAQVDAVVNVTKHILEASVPEFAGAVPEYLQFADQKNETVINNDLLSSYSIEFAQKYRDLLFDFLELIVVGDHQRARISLQTFLQEIVLLNPKNMRDYKMFLQTINDYCHMALLRTSVHPLHILNQAASLRSKIEEETSLAKLELLPREICRKYCLLVKNHANPECSKLTKDVMAHIQFHLEEDLTLNSLAALFQKNASVLSSTFSREAGMSLTAYIQHTRIQAALKLLNATDMSVSEIATAVGYQDFSYFSKVFSKNVGCSPRAYRTGK